MRHLDRTHLVISLCFLSLLTIGVSAQRTVDLPQVVTQPNHKERVFPNEPGPHNITQVRSDNDAVTASAYGTNLVEVYAQKQGRAHVTFFDSAQRVSYRVAVWVQPPGEGTNSGLDSTSERIPDVTMQINTTRNVPSPVTGAHNINSVSSSNQSVATARTEPPDRIQVYARALGDTFINFNDRGRRFQVHVYVRNQVDPGPMPGPSPKPVSGADNGERLDPNLVGTWRSTKITGGNGAGTTSGGSGIVLSIKADRSVLVDYSGMDPYLYKDFQGKTFQSQQFGGSARGHIATKNGTILIKSVEGGDLTRTSTVYGKTTSNNAAGLGFMLISAPYTIAYVCSGDHLTIATLVAGTPLQTFELVREQ